MKSAIPLLFAAASFSAATHAQTLGWLPISDLPLSVAEANHTGGGPGISTLCFWDPDGDGPAQKVLVVFGALYLTIPGGEHIAYLDDSGWHGIAYQNLVTSARTAVAYRAPGTAHEDLYFPAALSTVVRYDGTAFTNVNIDNGAANYLTVGDMDGPGPIPEKLYAVSNTSVSEWDGTTATVLQGGATLPGTLGALVVWDPDGPGPQTSKVVVASRNIPNRLYQWDGSAWSAWTQFDAISGTNNKIYSLRTIDFDGDGPGIPELVAAGAFGVVDGATIGPIAIYRNNAWVGLAAPLALNKYIAAIAAFDPDGAGPLPQQIVVTGEFAEIDGVPARNIAYNDGTWHAFPTYWGGAAATSAYVTNEAPYSDSPQLIIGGVQFRPNLGRYALSGGPSGVQHNPDDDNGFAGRTASIAVVPTGDELTFRWYKGDVALNDGITAAGSTISGVYGPRLTITSLAASDVGQYRVQIGNAYGIVTSAFATIGIGCPADFNNDNGVDFFDYLDFVQALSDGSVSADFNVDGVIDFFDYLDFVQAFSAGC